MVFGIIPVSLNHLKKSTVCHQRNTRVYTKEPKECDFEFKDGKLQYNNPRELDFTNADKIFPSFKKANKELSVQETISYYLNNNIVPVNYFFN